MAGKRVVVVARRTYTFTNLAGSATQSLVIERALDVTGYTEATLQVVSIAQTYASTQVLSVSATPVQILETDPQTDYLTAAPAATATFTTGTSGKIISAPLTSNFGSHIQLSITATQPASAAALACTITVIIILKE